MKDKLESYFKKHLKDDQLIEEGWNTPSMDVWDNTSQQLDEEKKNRKSYLLFFLLGITIILLMILGYKNIQLNNKLVSFEKTHNTKTIDNVIVPSPSTDNPTKRHRVENNLDLNSAENKHTTLTNKERASRAKDKPKVTSRHHKNKNTALKSPPETKPISVDIGLVDVPKDNNKTQKEHSNKESTTAPPLSELPILSLKSIASLFLNIKNTKNHDYLEEQLKSKKVNINKATPKNSLEFDLFFGPTLAATPMKPQPLNSPLKGYNKFQWTFNYGINIGYEFRPDFYIKSGLEWENIKSWSYTNIDMSYNSDNDYTNANGEIINVMSITMPTPTGNLRSAVVFRQKNSNMLEMGDLYEANMEIYQKYNYLKIPFMINYRKQLSQRHSFGIGLGLNFMALISSTDKFVIVLTKKDDHSPMHVKSSDLEENLNMQKTLFSYQGELEYRYLLSKKMSLTFGANYFKTISPLYSIDNITTKAVGINFKTGISIQF